MSANVPTPARVSTPAELDALPIGSVVRYEEDGGLPFARTLAKITETVWHSTSGSAWLTEDLVNPDSEPRMFAILYRPDRDLLAEAEARGYERGKRDALTDLRSRVYNGAPDPYQAFYNYGLAPLLDAEIDRAAETPGGAA